MRGNGWRGGGSVEGKGWKGLRGGGRAGNRNMEG